MLVFIRLLRRESLSPSFSLSVLSCELMSDLMFSRTTSLLSAKFPLALARSNVRTEIGAILCNKLNKQSDKKDIYSVLLISCFVFSNHRCPAGVNCSCVS